MTTSNAAVAAPRARVGVSAGVYGIEREFWRGVTAMLPLAGGYAPFAFLIGVAVANSVAPAAAWSGVWLIFAGAAHLTAIQLVDSGTGVFVAAVTAVVVNARLALFSVTLAPYWRGTGIASRLAAATTIIDPTWLVAMPAFAEAPDAAAGRRFYYGASAVMWVVWPAMVSVGVGAGVAVPPGSGLELLAPLCLMAMVAVRARTCRGRVCVAAAAVAATASAHLPSALSLLASLCAGVGCVALVERVSAARRGV